MWEKLWTRDEDVDMQKELGWCDLNPRYEVGDIKAAASRFKVRTATVDGVHPGMMKFCEDHVIELVGSFLYLFDKGGR